MNAYTGALGEWVRRSFTFTPTHNYLISYWFASSGNMKIDVANIQIEHKPHATSFTTSSRSATNSLKDLTGNQTIDLNTVSFNSSGALVFDGTDDRIDLGSLSDYFVPGVAAITVESVFKITSGASGSPGPLFENYRFNLWYQYSNDKIYFAVRTGSPETAGYQTAVEMESTPACSAKGNFNYVVAVYETTGPTQGRLKLYINGQFAGQADGLKIGSYPLFATWIGQSNHGGYGTYKLNGQVALTKMYTRALQQSEVENNYRNLKGRFNLA
jgi:hypothetical protein